MKALGLGFGALVLVVGVVVAIQLPDLKRYMKIRSM
jgi:hypothetical protein